MQEFAKWALAASSDSDQSTKQNFYLGVIMGIRDARTHRRTEPGELDPVFHGGYVASRVLINKVLVLGGAPEGGFDYLLSLPESATLRPRTLD